MVSQALRTAAALVLAVCLLALSSVGVSAGYVEGVPHKHKRMRSSVREAAAAKRAREADAEDDDEAGEEEDDVRGDEDSLVQTDSEEEADEYDAEDLDQAEDEAAAEAEEDDAEDEEQAGRHEKVAQRQHGKKRQAAARQACKGGDCEEETTSSRTSGGTLALDTSGKVHSVKDYHKDMGLNTDAHHLDYESGGSHFDRLSNVLGFSGKRVGVDKKGNIRHEFKDFTQTDWYPVTKQITDSLPTQITELQSALGKQHSSAEAAYSESVKYRNLIKDLMSELTHYQEGEHKFRDQVFSREDERSNKIKESLQFKPSEPEGHSEFNDRSRETELNHDAYMQTALEREDDRLNKDAEDSTASSSFLQADEAEDEAPAGGASLLQAQAEEEEAPVEEPERERSYGRHHQHRSQDSRGHHREVRHHEYRDSEDAWDAGFEGDE